MTLRKLYLRWRTTHDWRDVVEAVLIAAVMAVLFYYVWEMFSLLKTL